MSSSSWRNRCRYSPDEITYVMDENGEKKSLGMGGQGFVYLAHVHLGWGKGKTLVAVKHLSNENSPEFEQEIEIVSKIHHDHLVSLLGFCEEFGQKILLYEYMGKGSLAAYVKMGCPVSLSWPQWLNICLGVARGLQYLHTKTKENPKGITHRDVKPGNILLSESWVAKLSDFGTFKLSSNNASDKTTRVIGTPGYLAPEYQMSRRAATHSDVYSFGVVLFQVLCRKMPYDRDDTYILEEDGSLASWAEQNVDAKLKGEIPDDSLKAFSAIIGECLQYNPKKRPTMDEVVRKLETVSSGLQNVGIAPDVCTPTKSSIHVLDKELQNGSLEFSHLRQFLRGYRMLEGQDAAREYIPTDLCFSLIELEDGTNNFDKKNIMGRGEYASIYLANLDLRSRNGKTPVAVKAFTRFTDFQRVDFTKISRIRHPHIVTPIGYCNELGRGMLVYEYMKHGSLSNLVSRGSTTRVSFGWKGWLKICLGAARGLQHLHTETDEFPGGIIHRDVKPGHILLDENWVAKVSGIELLKLPQKVQRNRGAGLAPETLSGQTRTAKADVYAFGGVMFQVLCRKTPKDPGDDGKYRQANEDFRDWAMKNARGDIKEDGSGESLRFFIRIIEEAMQQDPSKRPTMKQVVTRLEIALSLQH